MPEVGSASLAIIPSFKGFESALERGAAPGLKGAGSSGGAVFGDAAGRSAGRRFGGVFKTAAKASLVGLVGAGALAFKLGKDSVGLASDLNESLNAVNVTYGKQARAVKALGREAATSLGLSNTEFNSLSVRFAAFSKTIAGEDKKKVVSTLDDLTTRAADFASVMNLEVNEAAQLFQSGLAGETEPLRRFGLDLSAAAVEAHAYATGIASGKGELTEAEKIQARYSLLMKQTSKTQGDFANTSDSLANRQRILNARWDDARAKLGQGLLPYMEDLSGWVLDKGLPAFEDFSEWFNSEGLPAIQDFAEDLKPLAESLLPAVGDALGIVRDAVKEAAPFAKDMVDSFNNMPDWAKTAVVGGGLALGAGAKLGLGKKAAGGLTRSVLGKASPVPVFVVNDGFGGKGSKAADVGGKGGLLTGSMKTLGPLAVAAAASYGAYEFSKYAKQKRAEQRMPGAAGTEEHVKKVAQGFSDATFAAETYNAELERAQDQVTVLTNGVTAFATPAERLRDDLAEITRGATATITAPGLSSALTGTQLLLDRLQYLDGRQARAYVAVQYSESGRQSLGGLQEFTTKRAAGGYVPGYTDKLLVGERGEEVLDLSGGAAKVTPNHQLRADSSRGGGSQRVVLDFGAGKTLSGWIQDEIADRDAFAGTRGRMG